ncbi:MAG: AMP-dependent synthetase/ligase [Fidelibacterota bacterium]
MKKRPVITSNYDLPEYLPNLALMLNRNSDRFSDYPIYQEVQNGQYRLLSWDQFQKDVIALQQFFVKAGIKPADRVAILSRNRREMLELELAVMAMGAVSVPIFAGYPANRAAALVEFCDPRIVVVADQDQYQKLAHPESFHGIIHFDPLSTKASNLISFESLLQSTTDQSDIIGADVDPDTVTLMMYTSGTMGKPKLVQLTHKNILSQQAAMRVLWKLSNHDRFLCYLPWHHSFGGIFEKYAAITNGAVLSLEHGYGKNIELLLDNWKKVKPTVFFSVPRIYQELTTRILQTPELELIIFHDELRFIFTAAAPLPKNISDIFKSRGVPVYEGWGLTETAPCCTVTDPELIRKPGIVGKPIPGISLSLKADGEILVKGPNIMKGYFRNPEATAKVLTTDGWFATGDVGEFTATGLRLISRKDRIFKLSNAEKVIPTEIENLITKDCTYLSHAYVAGSGKDYPVTLLFPNKAMFSQITDESRLKVGCACPNQLEAFADCLKNCLKEINQAIEEKYARLHTAMLIDYELTIENEELTPSMKLAPNVVGKVFKANIEYLFDDGEPIKEPVYIINLE